MKKNCVNCNVDFTCTRFQGAKKYCDATICQNVKKEIRKEQIRKKNIRYKKTAKGKANRKRYCQAHRDTLNRKSREWFKNNPHKKREYNKKYYNNPQNNVRMRISTGINSSLKRKGAARKHNNTFKMLGYSKIDLVKHLESRFTDGMSWDNMSEWHIDHIRPVSSFNFTTTECEDFKKCWALENLQPLWAADNISKGDKWDGEVNA